MIEKHWRIWWPIAIIAGFGIAFAGLTMTFDGVIAYGILLVAIGGIMFIRATMWLIPRAAKELQDQRQTVLDLLVANGVHPDDAPALLDRLREEMRPLVRR